MLLVTFYSGGKPVPTPADDDEEEDWPLFDDEDEVHQG